MGELLTSCLPPQRRPSAGTLGWFAVTSEPRRYYETPDFDPMLDCIFAALGGHAGAAQQFRRYARQYIETYG